MRFAGVDIVQVPMPSTTSRAWSLLVCVEM